MAILNLTPDSFYDGGRLPDINAVLHRAEQYLREGAAILDIGGASTRPGAAEVPEYEELQRILPAIETLSRHFPNALLSVDTYRATVARAAVEAGASIVNDISAGAFDKQLFQTVADLKVPYILMHLKGTPNTMQDKPVYQNVVREVMDFFIANILKLRHLGVYDIVLDPGFGFGKSLDHNFELLRRLHEFHLFDLPLLAGISRKSMICKTLKINPDKALNGTTALHMVALQQGTRLLRVHDVKEAVEVIRLWEMVTAPHTHTTPAH